MSYRVVHRARYVCDKCGSSDLGWDDMKPDDWTQGSIRDKATGNEVGVADYCAKCSAKKPIAS